MRDGLFQGSRPWAAPASQPAAEPRFERRVWSIAELTRSVRSLLESRFASVWVEGEISNLSRAPSGHWYFTLKDASAQVRAAMFKRENIRARFEVQDGQSVLCRGRLSVYDKRGDYQLIVDEIEPRGSGALQLQFEQLRARLESEGLFAAERKRPLPLRPTRVGIVTSPTGAAIRDLLEVITRRDGGMSILMCPTRVQGEGAARDIAAALALLGRSRRVDVVIVGRGGGSLEDLWAFNEEVVARAIALCPVPVVSAVGHEVDFTIADFVADVRAPTPSAAAEIVVPVRAELRSRVEALAVRASRALHRRAAELRTQLAARRAHLADPRHALGDRRRALDELGHRALSALRLQEQHRRRRWSAAATALQKRHPARELQRQAERLRLLRVRIDSFAQVSLAGRRRDVALLSAKLDALSPLAILARGYAILRRPGGAIVRTASDTNIGDRLNVRLGHGAIHVRVEGVGAQEPSDAPRGDTAEAPPQDVTPPNPEPRS